MQCPNCGSNNIYVSESNLGTKGYGFCRGICGYICFGPIGILCGLFGLGKPKGRRIYIRCNNCGVSQNVTTR